MHICNTIRDIMPTELQSLKSALDFTTTTLKETEGRSKEPKCLKTGRNLISVMNLIISHVFKSSHLQNSHGLGSIAICPFPVCNLCSLESNLEPNSTQILCSSVLKQERL